MGGSALAQCPLQDGADAPENGLSIRSSSPSARISNATMDAGVFSASILTRLSAG